MDSTLYYDANSECRHNVSTLKRRGMSPESDGIYPLRNVTPAYNRLYESYRDLGTVSGDPETGFQINYEVVELPPERCAEQLKTAITKHKWHTINAGIDVNGTPVLTAEANRNALFQTTESVESGRIQSVPWKSPTGWIEATAEQLVPLRDAVELHMKCCFQREKELHNEIESALQATDPHFALSAIEWQAGWPETLSPEATQSGGADVQ